VQQSTDVGASIQKAAEIRHVWDRSPYNGSLVDAAVARAVQSEVVTRIPHARLVWLRGKLTAEQAKVTFLARSRQRRSSKRALRLRSICSHEHQST